MRVSGSILWVLTATAVWAAEPNLAAEKARAAVGPFKKSLKEALVAALAKSPEAAIEVCATQAPALAARASTPGVTVGRSALKLRSPANAPRPWVADAMKTLAVKPQDGQSVLVDLGKGKSGYAETIVIQPMCLTCHGKSVAAPVAAAVRARYPTDQAVGFDLGEFRGVFWAEVTR